MVRKLSQTLLLDADDTLWENNIFFDQSIDNFIAYLNHPKYSPAEVREHLNTIERERVAVHGYGLKSFRKSLAVCHELLSGLPAGEAHDLEIARCTASISGPEIVLLPGVQPTLANLSQRHRLILVTKGDHDEQIDKLARSGLADYFAAVEVLHEKHEAAYRALQERYSLAAECTWMIGNSPKSDVNPALAAGMNAIHLPHHSCWVLEHEALEAPQSGHELLVLDGIGRLLEHF